RIEKATNTHLTYLHESGDIRRKIQAASIALSVKDIRSGETHRMHVAESASKIKLKLKEYDIQAIHFKTMLENETAYLVSQSSRVGEEVQINNAFILTTYENQMRFSSEQVRLADEEFKLRVTAIQRANEEEKRYFDDLIQHQLRSYETALQTENHAYEAKLYQNRHMLSQTTDPKIHKILEKEAKELQKNHDAYIAQHHKKIRDDQLIQRAKARIADLEEEYLDAVDDAVNLRDETVQEMSSLYEESKERYLALKPYLESKMNVLDPSFFEHLKRIESRYSYRIKLAEAKLDEETQQLLEEYRQVSFESLEAKALDEHLTQMNEYERLKLDCEQRYANAMKQIESEYQASVQKLDESAKSGASQLEIVASAFLQKSNAILTQYQKNLSALDEQRKQSVIHLDDQLQKQIIKLKSEYDNAITENQRFVEALSTNFEKLLSSYRGYLRTTGKDKDIVSIRRENKKRYAKARKGRYQHLQSDSKQFLQHKEKSTSR
ncbi:MAG: hypothetical protein PHP32_03945, partial [Candidatus Izemoplasmatales bacterium]|nr:hypothetical protein [Candidatus Izemoplasmatales bacterium]